MRGDLDRLSPGMRHLPNDPRKISRRPAKIVMGYHHARGRKSAAAAHPGQCASRSQFPHRTSGNRRAPLAPGSRFEFSGCLETSRLPAGSGRWQSARRGGARDPTSPGRLPAPSSCGDSRDAIQESWSFAGPAEFETSFRARFQQRSPRKRDLYRMNLPSCSLQPRHETKASTMVTSL